MTRVSYKVLSDQKSLTLLHLTEVLFLLNGLETCFWKIEIESLSLIMKTICLHIQN